MKKGEMGYLRDLLFEGDLVIRTASAYSNIERHHLKGKLEKYNNMTIGRGEEYVNSVLGSIIVGTVTFVYKMVVNCVKYILMAIKALIFDSELIPNIIRGIMSIFESSSYFKKVRVLEVNDVKKMIDAIKVVLDRRLKKLESNPIRASLYELIDDKMINNTKIVDPKYIARNSINDKDIINFINKLRKEYGASNKLNDVKKMRFDRKVTLNNVADRNLIIVKYKDLLEYYQQNMHQVYLRYLNGASVAMKNLELQLEKIQKKIDDPTREEEIIVKVSEVFIPLFVVDLKNMTEGVERIKKELIGDMLVMTEDLK